MIMNFGLYFGMDISKVPTNYLLWCHRNMDEFKWMSPRMKTAILIELGIEENKSLIWQTLVAIDSSLDDAMQENPNSDEIKKLASVIHSKIWEIVNNPNKCR